MWLMAENIAEENIGWIWRHSDMYYPKCNKEWKKVLIKV